MTHALKTWPEYYKQVESGMKTFELRKNDRPFKAGDYLLLQEWDNETQRYTGKGLTRRITYILFGECAAFGLDKGYCIISFGNY